MSIKHLNTIIIQFLSFELSKNLIKCFFSKKNNKNYVYIYLFNTLNEILLSFYNTIFFSKMSLIEIVGFDIKNLINYNAFFNIFLLNTFNFLTLVQYNFYNYFSKLRLLINFFFEKNNLLFSLENKFLNSNWLERELVEFFGLNFIFKKDSRNLLLDYNYLYNPLLKNFPTEGYEELYFNFNNYSLSYIKNEFIEL